MDSIRNRRDSYADTMRALDELQSTIPSFDSSYDAELNRIYDKLINREGFRYEPNSDPLYNSYRDNYISQGKLAMRDSMGQTASLTGGYSSSYAQSVAQQSFDGYLERLSSLMPQLYSTAYSRYADEGEALQKQYSMLKDRADGEYRAYRDRLSDAERIANRADDMERQDYDRRLQSFDRLMKLMSEAGYEPSPEELEQAGMTQAQADAILGKNRAGGYAPPTGRYSYTGGSGKSTADKKLKNPNEQAKLNAIASNYVGQDKQRRK